MTVTNRPANSFAAKLDGIMTILKISNAYLSKQLNVDPSYISRLRNGTRVLKPTSHILDALGQKLAEYIWRQGKVEEVRGAMGTKDLYTESKEQFSEDFVKWLKVEDCNQIQAAISLIEVINQCFMGRTSMDMVRDVEIPGDILNSKKTTYIGVEGLKDSLLRFFGTANVNHSKEITMYSDHNVSFIQEDQQFFKAWTYLMLSCLVRGTKINIIHYIGRELEEIVVGIRVWLPLYIAGNIESYCRTDKEPPAFSHTILLDHGKVALEGISVRGDFENGKYYYQTTKDGVKACETSLDLLKKESEQMISTHLNKDIISLIEYETDRRMYLACFAMPIETMEEDQLLELLEGSELDKADIDLVIEKYRVSKEKLAKMVKEANISTIMYNMEAEPRLMSVDCSLFNILKKVEFTTEKYLDHKERCKEFFTKGRGKFKVTEDQLLSVINIFSTTKATYFCVSPENKKVLKIEKQNLVDSINLFLQKTTGKSK